jgi:hypothetical protein
VDKRQFAFMVSLGIAWLTIALEVTLLWRGVFVRSFSRFPYFYFYLSFVLVQSLFLLSIMRWWGKGFAAFYWGTQGLALVIGSLVIFEVYRIGLRRFPGTAKMARNLLYLVFALTIAKVLANQWNGRVWGLEQTTGDMERDFRIVQACSLLALVIALLLYRVHIGRHLKGIITGYGLFVVSSVVQLSLLSYLGASFQKVWHYLQPVSYLVFLTIWTVALWSPVLEEAPEAAELPPGGYSRLARKTEEDLEKIRLGFGKAVR